MTEDAAPTTPDITFRTWVLLQWYSAPSMLLIDPEKIISLFIYYSYQRKLAKIFKKNVLGMRVFFIVMNLKEIREIFSLLAYASDSSRLQFDYG